MALPGPVWMGGYAQQLISYSMRLQARVLRKSESENESESESESERVPEWKWGRGGGKERSGCFTFH